MPFAQLVIGAPGAGKSTYCDGMQQFLGTIGRKSSVVNLDPANDGAGYAAALDVRQLVTLEEIMEADELGPNGGILYAMEELEGNWEWLEAGLRGLDGGEYVLFDCPGQVEVFTHHESLRNVVRRIEKMGYRASLYISSLLLSLRAMLQMDLPHVNVLTKIDKLADYGPLAFPLDFYTEVQDLDYLLPELAAEKSRISHPKFERLNAAICELVQDFSLVAYETLAVEDKRSMMALLHAIDRAGGYAFGAAEGANDTVWQVAMRDGFQGVSVRDVQERWIDRRDEFDERERRQWAEEAQARREQAEAEAAAAAAAAAGGDATHNMPDIPEPGENVDNGQQATSNGVKFVRKS